MSTVLNHQDNDFNNKKLTNLDSAVVNRDPSSDSEVSNKNYVDDELDKNTILRFSQTLQNYFKVSVGNDIYNSTKYDKLQITDTTEFKFPNVGSDFLKIGKLNVIISIKIQKSELP